MCKVLDYREARGEAKGRAEGEECLNKLIHILADKGYQLAEILSLTSDAEKRAKLYKEYEIA